MSNHGWTFSKTVSKLKNGRHNNIMHHNQAGSRILKREGLDGPCNGDVTGSDRWICPLLNGLKYPGSIRVLLMKALYCLHVKQKLRLAEQLGIA